MNLLTAHRPERLRHLLLGPGVLLADYWPGRGLNRETLDGQVEAALTAGGGVLGITRDAAFEVRRTYADVRLAGQRGPVQGIVHVLGILPLLTGVIERVHHLEGEGLAFRLRVGMAGHVLGALVEAGIAQGNRGRAAGLWSRPS